MGEVNPKRLASLVRSQCQCQWVDSSPLRLFEGAGKGAATGEGGGEKLSARDVCPTPPPVSQDRPQRALLALVICVPCVLSRIV